MVAVFCCCRAFASQTYVCVNLSFCKTCFLQQIPRNIEMSLFFATSPWKYYFRFQNNPHAYSSTPRGSKMALNHFFGYVSPAFFGGLQPRVSRPVHFGSVWLPPSSVSPSIAPPPPLVPYSVSPPHPLSSPPLLSVLSCHRSLRISNFNLKNTSSTYKQNTQNQQIWRFNKSSKFKLQI